MSYINRLTPLRLEDLTVGMTATYQREVTDNEIQLFATVSGDHNPVHMDEEFASSTMFKGRIAHGMLSASFISTAIATKLPGPGTIYLAQNLKFRNPVRLGDMVTTEIEVTEVIAEKRRVALKTVCRVGETVVIDGEATVLVPG